jgi:hypothetical protein
MHDWHTDVKKYVVAFLVCEQLLHHLPRVLVNIALQEMIEAAIAGDFKFGSYT